MGSKPSKGKTKGILLGKLIFPPSTCVTVILQRLEAFTCMNCSFQLWYLFMMCKSITLTKIERNTGSTWSFRWASVTFVQDAKCSVLLNFKNAMKAVETM